MTRHQLLSEFSHDHRDGLAQARRLQQAAGLGPTARTAAARNFLVFADTDLLTHFRAEEAVLDRASRIPGSSQQELLQSHALRMRAEHGALRQAFERLRQVLLLDEAPAPAQLDRTGLLLQEHIRYEEREFFEDLADCLDEGMLAVPEAGTSAPDP